MKTIILTDEEYDLLETTLAFATDEGPSDEGWKSAALKALVDKVRAAGNGEASR